MGGMRGGLVTDTEQHCVCGYFMSKVMRRPGSAGVFSRTLLTAFCPPSSELFKVTGILNESSAIGSYSCPHERAVGREVPAGE